MSDARSEPDFAGKVAVVTGGGAGIGFAIARAFARSGARVAIAGRTKERLAHAAASIGDAFGAPVLIVPADVGKHADCERIIAATVERFDALDQGAPAIELSGLALESEMLEDELVDTLVVEDERDRIDVLDVVGGDDRLERETREQGDLLADVAVERLL